MVITYKYEKINTPNKLIMDFGPKFFKASLVTTKSTNTDVIKIPNSLYFISETKVKVVERDFKDAVKIKAGISTKQEIESSQLLMQADERFIDVSNHAHIEKAYQNFFEQLPLNSAIDFREDGIDFEKWSVFLALPYVKNFEVILKTHLDFLKSMGFIYVKPIDYLTSSFYSQSSTLGQENVKHKFGIIVNVSEKTDIGVFDEQLVPEGTAQIPIGTSTVVDYALAFLRDLAIRGFKRELLEEWIYEQGTCLNDSPTVMKNIRRKSIDIKPILNAPRVMFDYNGVTNMSLEVNSIQDGITNLLTQNTKKIKKNIKKILSNVIVVGPGAVYKSFGENLLNKLKINFKTDKINVLIGTDPRNSEFNGLFEYLRLETVYEVYNVTKIELDEKQRKELEKQFSSQIKVINDYLKEMKSRKLFLPENLPRFSSEINSLFAEVSNLPDGLSDLIESNIFRELQNWAKDFGKNLKNLKKISNKNLESANIALKEIDVISNTVDSFNRHWLMQIFSSQLTKIRNEVNTEKLRHEEKISNVNFKIISKILKKNKQSWILLEDLSKASNLEVPSILKIMDKILSANIQLGYLDDRIVVFTKEILPQADQFLVDLIFNIEKKIDQKITQELEEDILQGLDYCNFLIRGYSHFEDRFSGQEILSKKDFLLEERKNLKL